MTNNVLLVNIGRLKKESYLDANVSEDSIRVAVVDIQNVIVERVLGSCLFDALLGMVCDKSINGSENELYKRLLDVYLFPVFVYGVPAEVNIPLSLKTRNAGVVQASTEDKRSAVLEEVKYLNDYYRNKADFYINRAVDFLRCHFDHFPELRNCGCDWCTTRGLQGHFNNPLCLT